MSEKVQHESANNKGKRSGTRWNFGMICFAYICAFTSLQAVTSLQSSINTDKNVGLNSVAITYGTSLVTSLLFTTSLGYIFGYKWSIVGGQFGILVYVASNMYPKQWLMYSTAVICGSLRACLSMAQNSYVAALANDESENDDDAEIKTRKYFGIFLTAFQSVLRNTPKTTNTNSTQCGANYLTSEHQMQDDNHQLISQKTIYILYSIFSGIICVSIVLTIIFLVQRRDNKKDDDSQGLLRKSLNHTLSTLKTSINPNNLLLIPLGFWSISAETFFMGAFTNHQNAKQRVIIIHGSAISPGIINRHWYKWLQTELSKLDIDALAPAMPDEREAKDSIWIPYLINNLNVKENDILVGHSSGAMAILRLCEQMKIKGLILVSAGYDKNDKNQLYNWNTIKSNTQWIEQFHSSDDPFTPVDSSRHIAKEVQSIYHEFNDRNHFLCPDFPDIINVIKRHCQLS
ncbi:unnamed protein product [Adineta steineri]|uniref:Uncharacterized protein n=1 Tax=Adineta steineri TaxID=433720 RepID=A0A814DWF4_9BILA|nr:unnamed protein product [Adineta steineri]CAF0998493.1 unnamed protein product [Adineta steineri]